MRIIISNTAQEPIYEQILKQIKNSIISGEVSAGDMLPSIRNLAHELQISVITTKRAYDELETEGFVVTVPGKGTYVSEQNKDLIKEKRLKMLEDKIQEVVDEAKLLGINRDELIEMLKLIFEEGIK
jgi:GntR family transcriptional regulator